MKQICSFLGNDALIVKSSKRFLKGFPLAPIDGMTRGDLLRKQFGKLTELEDAGRGVIAEIAFRQCSKLHKLGIINRQKIKIFGKSHPKPAQFSLELHTMATARTPHWSNSR